MEDGNVVNTKDDKIDTALLANLYSERHPKLTSNGHDPGGETSNLSEEVRDQCRLGVDTAKEDKCRKRINPLRIHLGKRPFVDNSLQYFSSIKRNKPIVNKPSDTRSASNSIPRAPKLIPKRVDRSQFHHVASQMGCSTVDNEQDKPTPRLVPKSQLLQFKKGKVEKGAQLKEYAQSLGLQPMVKFKCRKCCSMSFKTLAMLKDHQLICRAQAKEPTLSPETTPMAEASPGGPSRVTRKVYLCSACGTYYENWNLFLHMREVHNRHICLFCLGMFSKAEKLSLHLTNKHNVQEFNYDNKKEFMDVYNGTLYLMCCACDEICSEQDDFFNHDCNNVKPKPVPVLVSKNSVKANSVKSVKNCNELSTNGPTSVVNPLLKSVNDKKSYTNELKPETVTSHTHNVSLESEDCEPTNSDTSISSDTSVTTSKDTSNTIDSGMEIDNSVVKPEESPTHENEFSQSNIIHSHPNGDDTLEQSDESNPPSPDNVKSSSNIDYPTKSEEAVCTPVEKEGGIKLKLSLNKANSPVIINSTVDPTVGQQNVHKPPSRVRRPPKRYEKDTPLDTTIPSKPSIKMTICDKADSPFVKTTIIENNKETTLKTLLNNNLESVTKSPEHKIENAIKSTIYDNKIEDVNTLNRVPKLTVRVPKELLDKDSSSDYSSDSDVSDKLTVDENSTIVESNKHQEETPLTEQLTQPEPAPEQASQLNEEIKEELAAPKEEDVKPETPIDVEHKIEPKTESMELDVIEPKVEEPEIPVTELSLDKPLDKYPLKDLLKVFLASTGYNCIYCNHVRKIAVNCEQLSLHMVAQHRFSATVDSITAEELLPETITAKLKTGAKELNSVYINLSSYDSAEMYDEVQNDRLFECFQCYFKTAIHKDLYLHNRKMHQKTILLCVMCKSNFYSYSELLCHLCPGTYDSEHEVKFRCCLCNVDTIPSSFRLMVHLRKIHHTCDVCLEFCHNQSRLSNHIWKHKLHHLCYRCGIAYRNKPDITNHLFWKHGTESVLCKKCLQKKWPHVYHFCSPPAIFTCDECSLQFTKAVYLKVHKRFHSEEYPHVCSEEGCTEKFVSKKLLDKHIDDHRKKMIIEDLNEDHSPSKETPLDASKEPIPIIDLINDNPKQEVGTSVSNSDAGAEQLSKKAKKKKMKEKDALLLDVNLPALDLSESDSSDESDSGIPNKEDVPEQKIEKTETETDQNADNKSVGQTSQIEDIPAEVEEEKSNNEQQQILDIWDNFKKYQAKVEKVEKQKEKTPPLVPIRKHVCESDHDYCLIPSDLNGDDESYGADKKKNKRSPKKRHGDLSSSSSSSSDSDSSCSCGSNCSCSSSSGSSSSTSSDSDSSDESCTEKKKKKQLKKILPNRRISNGSNVDVMGMSETPILVPEKTEPPVPETDLDTNESETDEEFYDKHPQLIGNKLRNEKRIQSLLSTVGPSDGGSVSGDASRPATPVKEEMETKVEIETKDKEDIVTKEKPTSSKKKSKKKKKSKSSKKHGPIKINIPKEVIAKSEVVSAPLLPNKITISLQSNTVQIPEVTAAPPPISTTTPTASSENKRASKRRRVPNKFYGYSSDEETPSSITALKPHQPPKLEWRKEDLPSPVTHKAKKELPSTVTPQRMYNYIEPIRLTTPIPDPEPPKILMNTESMESSDSDSSDEGNLEIYQPQPNSYQTPAPIPPPTYLNSGTSSLPYPFQRPVVRQAREGESVYCYCRCPYDEVSEMIACDAEGCPIEWFHFECVGIMVPPKGRWYCPECRKNQSFSGYR